MTIPHNSIRLFLKQEGISASNSTKKSVIPLGVNRLWKQKVSGKRLSFRKMLLVVTTLALLLINTVSPVLANASSEMSSDATTLRFIAVADAQVTQNRPNKNYGTSAELGVDGRSDAASSAYIRFDVANVSGLVQSAVLRVYCKVKGTKNGPAAYWVADNNWAESGRGGITWGKKPALSSDAYDNKRVIWRASWVDYNVTGLVNGNGTYTFALVADSRDGVVFSSRESSKPPQLVLTTSSDAPAPATPTPLQENTATPTAADIPTSDPASGSVTPTAVDDPASDPASTPLPPTTAEADTATPIATDAPTDVPTATDVPTETPTPTFPPTSTPVPSLTNTPTALPTATLTNGSGFPVGWWLQQSTSLSLLGTYAASGERLFLLDGSYCGVDQLPTYKKFLTEAAKYNNKVIAKINCNDSTTQGLSDADLTTTVNALKSYPALWAWSTADEPEYSDDPAIRQRRHDRLLYSYNMIKQLDPSHPIFISFDFNGFKSGYAAQFYDVTDVIGIHAYPHYYNTDILSRGEMYDLWRDARTWAGNKPFIATMQGFGNGVSPYRSPTLAESRYQTFSAVVQGVPNILFWMNEWSEQSGDTGTVLTVMSEVQAIGTEMQNGVTNDPRIGVSVTDRNRLTYRFGTSNGRAAILAVNIANREANGATLSNVKFTVPAGYSSVQVLNENRTLPITNNTFTDSFTKFQVHIYLLIP